MFSTLKLEIFQLLKSRSMRFPDSCSPGEGEGGWSGLLIECLTSRRGPRTARVAGHTPEAVSAAHLNLGVWEDSALGAQGAQGRVPG